MSKRELSKIFNMELKVVPLGRKRRCPYCGSNKWKRIQAEPITLEELLSKGLKTRYLCKNCKREFLVEEGFKARLVKSVERCVFCQSKRKIEKVSKPDADLELYRCGQCGGYMGIIPEVSEKEKNI